MFSPDYYLIMLHDICNKTLSESETIRKFLLDFLKSALHFVSKHKLQDNMIRQMLYSGYEAVQNGIKICNLMIGGEVMKIII